MDFMRDTLWVGKPLGTFYIIDDFNREVLNIAVGKSIIGECVIAQLDQLAQWRGLPVSISVENGPEFIAQALKDWCKHPTRNIGLIFIQKGKPNQNGYVERLNRTFREDILDAYLFESVQEAQAFANNRLWMYNNISPHESLGNITPCAFLLKYGKLHCDPKGQVEFPTFQQDNHDPQPRPFRFEKSFYFI